MQTTDQRKQMQMPLVDQLRWRQPPAGCAAIWGLALLLGCSDGTDIAVRGDATAVTQGAPAGTLDAGNSSTSSTDAGHAGPLNGLSTGGSEVEPIGPPEVSWQDACGDAPTLLSCLLRCSDDDPATHDDIRPDGTCEHVPFSEGPSASALCNADTPCDGDGCAGQAVECRDGDPCTADHCERATGQCRHIPIPGCDGSTCELHTDCAADQYCYLGLCTEQVAAAAPLGTIRTKKPNLRRVVSYNVLEGLEPKPTWMSPNRLERVTAFLAATQPDVVAFQELNGMTASSLGKLAPGWQHEHVAIAGNTAYRVGLTALRPIKSSAFLPSLSKLGVLHAQVEDVHYVVIHLHPHDPVARLQEAKGVLAYVAALTKDGEKVFLLGDFNALSPVDEGYYAVADLLSWLKQDGATKSLAKPMEFDTIGLFLGAGLVDLVDKHRLGAFPLPTMPTKNAPWGARIDYIMADENLATKARQAWVGDSPVRRGWSDHLPVVIDFLP